MKRSEQFKVRATEAQMDALRETAEEMDLDMSTIIRSLVDRFITQRQMHGPRLIWPVEFAHFGQGSPVVYESANDAPAAMVAETADPELGQAVRKMIEAGKFKQLAKELEALAEKDQPTKRS